MSNKKSISHSFSVSTIEDGEQGKRGRFYYYAGEFDSTNDDDTFVINDAQAPFFKHIESGQTRYHVFNPDGNPDHDLTMEEMWAISNNWNNRPWEAMTNDFKYLITEAIFSNFAHFGGAIISGDWMISTNGTLGGSPSTEYTFFDPLHPNDSTGTNFIPNYCVNLKTGATYQQEAYISGEIHAQSLSTEFVDVNYTNNQTYYINLDGEGEVKDEKNWNYRFVPSNTRTDKLSIVLPVNKYFHFGQRVILYNPSLSLVDGYLTAQNYISVESFFIEDFGMTGSQRPILGISATQPNDGWNPPNPPLPINLFKPVGKIWFTNGILELVCVPPYDGEQSDALCDWAMVNIGTNYYKVEELQQ